LKADYRKVEKERRSIIHLSQMLALSLLLAYVFERISIESTKYIFERHIRAPTSKHYQGSGKKVEQTELSSTDSNTNISSSNSNSSSRVSTQSINNIRLTL
jgi:hypothetical protein